MRAGTRTTTTALDARSARQLRKELVEDLVARVGDLDLAEDLAQDTLARLLRLTRQPRRGLAARARRIAADLLRAHEHRMALQIEFLTAAAAGLVGHPTPTPTPQDVLDLRASHACLVAALGRLPIDARRMVVLRDLSGVPIRQLAASLGCSSTSAKVRLDRARLHLAELYRRASGLPAGTATVPSPTRPHARRSRPGRRTTARPRPR
jgi:RNA polymerase sigma factor (sigma-70 family)